MYMYYYNVRNLQVSGKLQVIYRFLEINISRLLLRIHSSKAYMSLRVVWVKNRILDD